VDTRLSKAGGGSSDATSAKCALWRSAEFVAGIVKDSELEQVLIELFCLKENSANPDEAGIAAPETRSRFCEMAFQCGVMLLFSGDSHLVRSYPAGGEIGWSRIISCFRSQYIFFPSR
jgi:hypothetical protein